MGYMKIKLKETDPASRIKTKFFAIKKGEAYIVNLFPAYSISLSLIEKTKKYLADTDLPHAAERYLREQLAELERAYRVSR